MYTSLKLKSILDKIPKTTWENHAYIDDLIILSRYIKVSPKTYIGSLHFSSLKTKYKKEYLEILKEISPKRFENETYMQGKDKEKNNKINKIQNLRLEKLKQNWMDAGGKT